MIFSKRNSNPEQQRRPFESITIPTMSEAAVTLKKELLLIYERIAELQVTDYLQGTNTMPKQIALLHLLEQRLTSSKYYGKN